MHELKIYFDIDMYDGMLKYLGDMVLYSQCHHILWDNPHKKYLPWYKARFNTSCALLQVSWYIHI